MSLGANIQLFFLFYKFWPLIFCPVDGTLNEYRSTIKGYTITMTDKDVLAIESISSTMTGCFESLFIALNKDHTTTIAHVASFWIEMENGLAVLHLTTEVVLDKEKRAHLLASATSGKNEAAASFLGQLRDMFEQAMAAEVTHKSDVPDNIIDDLPNHMLECTDPEWDKYEQSTLRKLASTVKIGIRGGNVRMTVIISFA